MTMTSCVVEMTLRSSQLRNLVDRPFSTEMSLMHAAAKRRADFGRRGGSAGKRSFAFRGTDLADSSACPRHTTRK
jgi:hypothetical protein